MPTNSRNMGPEPPVQEAPPGVSMGPQGQPETTHGGKGSLLRADEIALIFGAQ